MKVFDLSCERQHIFEGWFASDEEFQAQNRSDLIACPMCGDMNISKRLSAPRLNLGLSGNTDTGTRVEGQLAAHSPKILQDLWVAAANHILSNTVNVGADFSNEARKIYYGECPERPIRGVATPAETASLLQEGIDVVLFSLPDVLKNTRQ